MNDFWPPGMQQRMEDYYQQEANRRAGLERARQQQQRYWKEFLEAQEVAGRSSTMNTISLMQVMGAMEKGKDVVNIMRIEYGPSSTIEQLITAEAILQVVTERIKTNGYDVPSDIANILDEVSADLTRKMRDSRRKELRALELKRDQLLSSKDKLRNLDAEIAALKAKLGA